MSASFPQMAFWVIFPVAGLIVLTGWILTIITAIKRLRSGNKQQGNGSHGDHVPPPPDWDYVDTVTQDGSHFVPLT